MSHLVSRLVKDCLDVSGKKIPCLHAILQPQLPMGCNGGIPQLEILTGPIF